MLDLPPVPPFRQDVGIAISDTSGASTPIPAEEVQAPILLQSKPLSVSSIRSPTKSTFDTPSSRAVIAKQHQRARTRKAFAAPASGPLRPTSQHKDLISSSSAGLLSASTNSSRSAYSSGTGFSIPTPTPAQRKVTALDEAIGRSRAASLTNPESSSSKSQVRPRPRTAEDSESSGDSRSTARPVPAIEPVVRTMSPPLAYPISTVPSPRFGISFAEQQLPPVPSSAERPKFSHMDTAATGRTVYTDASEGWDRSAAGTPLERSPSPEDSPVEGDEREFKVGRLPVFRRCTEALGALLPHASRRFIPICAKTGTIV